MASLSLVSVDKKRAHKKKMVTIGLNGVGFHLEGTKRCTLTRKDSTRSAKVVTAHSLSNNTGGTKAYAKFNLHGLTPGFYDIAYIVGETSTTLERAFKIEG